MTPVWLALALALARAEAQPGWAVEVRTTREGLPIDHLNDLAPGADGTLWIASFDGLIRFDGRTFEVMRAVAVRRDRGRPRGAGPLTTRPMVSSGAPSSAVAIGSCVARSSPAPSRAASSCAKPVWSTFSGGEAFAVSRATVKAPDHPARRCRGDARACKGRISDRRVDPSKIGLQAGGAI